MCKYCDYDYADNCIYIDPLDKQYYIDVQTNEWDEYDDDFVHQRVYIDYCPWCGKKLKDKT